MQGLLAALTGVPCSQETVPPYDPTVVLCLGPYGVPKEGLGFLCVKYPCVLLTRAGAPPSFPGGFDGALPPTSLRETTTGVVSLLGLQVLSVLTSPNIGEDLALP